MVTVKINGSDYQVKTEWSEINPDELKECKDFKDELKCLTTVPHEIIDKATNKQLWPIYTLLSFIDDMDNVPYEEALIKYDNEGKEEMRGIAYGPYDDFESAKGMLTVDCKPYCKWINAARVYFAEEKNPVRLIALGVSIVNQISIFLENYKDMINDPPDEDAIQAGVEDLSAFGMIGTALELAGGDMLKMPIILKKPAIRVYTILHYNWRKSKYQERLFNIRHPKNKPK